MRRKGKKAWQQFLDRKKLLAYEPNNRYIEVSLTKKSIAQLDKNDIYMTFITLLRIMSVYSHL